MSDLPFDVAEHNRRVFRTVTRDYLARDLEAAELWLLRQLRDRWPAIDMLDLGVGAGRTAFTFGALCRSYVGLDMVDEMLDLCRARVGEGDGVRFERGDARDLSPFTDPGFDLVLFSMNGIDALNHEDRIVVLQQVASALRPGGILFFSVHNLRCYPPLPEPLAFDRDDPFRSLFRMLQQRRFSARLRREARGIDLDAARTRGWNIMRDGAHSFQMLNFYIDPALQGRELEDAGFKIETVLDTAGAPVDARAWTTSPHVWYYCSLQRPM